MQTTSQTLMIRPVNFSANVQTMESNAFQKPGLESKAEINRMALEEFDDLVTLLRNAGVSVIVTDDTIEPATPDSIFPNNWVSFHDNGTIVLYPMQAENRRLERRLDVLETVARHLGTLSKNYLDLTQYELTGAYLEGTGSMVLDRDLKIAYACISPRTNETVLEKFCSSLGYTAVTFHATGTDKKAIYHTNVMMCVGSRFILICLDSIDNQGERTNVINSIKKSGKVLLTITLDQMNHFAGNMLELKNKSNEAVLVMSDSAFNAIAALHDELGKYCKIIHTPLDIIENNGGGSARCMIAEIHSVAAFNDEV